MKKFAILALSLVLTLGLMTACRRNSTDETAGPSTETTTKPTNASTAATTVPTTAPTTASTTPSENGMLEDGMIDGNGDAGSKGRHGNRLP